VTIVELDAAGVEDHLDELAQLLLDAHAANMALGLGLLWLTTHEDTTADEFYRRLDWTRLGVIPGYSTLPDGSLTGNAYYYLTL